MISKISAGGTETLFFYDADNKRVKKSQGLSSSLYFGESFEIIKGRPTCYVFAGTLRIALATDTGTAFFHKDHLGSTGAMSQEDGTVIDFGEYLPYGQDRNANALLQHSAYKFTDQEQDEGTGLYNYDARLYDPEIGQFVMADSIVPDAFNPQSLNRYAYCLNNPLIYTDPTGHHQETIRGTNPRGMPRGNKRDIFGLVNNTLQGVLNISDNQRTRALLDEAKSEIPEGEKRTVTIHVDTRKTIKDPMRVTITKEESLVHAKKISTNYTLTGTKSEPEVSLEPGYTFAPQNNENPITPVLHYEENYNGSGNSNGGGFDNYGGGVSPGVGGHPGPGFDASSICWAPPVETLQYDMLELPIKINESINSLRDNDFDYKGMSNGMELCYTVGLGQIHPYKDGNNMKYIEKFI